jgi:ubiquitin-protein ligase
MIRRLMREVADLERGDLSGLNIYTVFEEGNIRKGHALLIGPEGTPYAFCPLLFEFQVPEEYPLVPPRVGFLTSDEITRFHPNLYIPTMTAPGKVCLSILGTYSGPSWVSTMNLQTVLKSIYSLLNENPITNEPGWERYTLEDQVAKGYADFVQFRLVNHTLAEHARGHPGNPFQEFLNGEWATRTLPRLRALIQQKAVAMPESVLGEFPYGMSGRIAWASLALGA